MAVRSKHIEEKVNRRNKYLGIFAKWCIKFLTDSTYKSIPVINKRPFQITEVSF